MLTAKHDRESKNTHCATITNNGWNSGDVCECMGWSLRTGVLIFAGNTEWKPQMWSPSIYNGALPMWLLGKKKNSIVVRYRRNRNCIYSRGGILQETITESLLSITYNCVKSELQWNYAEPKRNTWIWEWPPSFFLSSPTSPSFPFLVLFCPEGFMKMNNSGGQTVALLLACALQCRVHTYSLVCHWQDSAPTREGANPSSRMKQHSVSAASSRSAYTRGRFPLLSYDFSWLLAFSNHLWHKSYTKDSLVSTPFCSLLFLNLLALAVWWLAFVSFLLPPLSPPCNFTMKITTMEHAISSLMKNKPSALTQYL